MGGFILGTKQRAYCLHATGIRWTRKISYPTIEEALKVALNLRQRNINVLVFFCSRCGMYHIGKPIDEKKFWKEKYICERHRRYKTEEYAIQAAGALYGVSTKKYSIYKCLFCGYWHTHLDHPKIKINFCGKCKFYYSRCQKYQDRKISIYWRACSDFVRYRAI